MTAVAKQGGGCGGSDTAWLIGAAKSATRERGRSGAHSLQQDRLGGFEGERWDSFHRPRPGAKTGGRPPPLGIPPRFSSVCRNNVAAARADRTGATGPLIFGRVESAGRGRIADPELFADLAIAV